jgi:hypothetical protein
MVDCCRLLVGKLKAHLKEQSEAHKNGNTKQKSYTKLIVQLFRIGK